MLSCNLTIHLLCNLYAADLLVCGSAPEIYRLSLSEGRFLTPLPSRSPGVNACGISPAHGLFAAAGEDGVLECFDLRQRTAAGHIDAAAASDSVRYRAQARAWEEA